MVLLMISKLLRCPLITIVIRLFWPMTHLLLIQIVVRRHLISYYSIRTFYLVAKYQSKNKIIKYVLRYKILIYSYSFSKQSSRNWIFVIRWQYGLIFQPFSNWNRLSLIMLCKMILPVKQNSYRPLIAYMIVVWIILTVKLLQNIATRK